MARKDINSLLFPVEYFGKGLFLMDEILESFNPFSELKIDLSETDTEYVAECEIGDFTKDEINIDFKNGYLKIKAEKKIDNTSDKKYIVKERESKSASRTIAIANDVDESNILAKINQNLLVVTLPKKVKQPDKKIEIQ